VPIVWFELLVKQADVAVKLSHTAAAIRVLPIRPQRRDGCPLGFEPGTPEDVTQNSRGLLVCFDLEGVPPDRSLRCTGVDGPVLTTFVAPVPAKALDRLTDVVATTWTWDEALARLIPTYPSSRSPPSAKRYTVSKVAP
jgi:hypothetical protein